MVIYVTTKRRGRKFGSRVWLRGERDSDVSIHPLSRKSQANK